MTRQIPGQQRERVFTDVGSKDYDDENAKTMVIEMMNKDNEGHASCGHVTWSQDFMLGRRLLQIKKRLS